MLGLADYGSSDEDEAQISTRATTTLPSPSLPKAVAPLPGPSKPLAKPAKKKKKKRITVALLPPDIQAALARGGTFDSDDEDDETPVRDCCQDEMMPSLMLKSP